MKILIIDDDAGLRKSVSLILTDADYEVVLAEDGESGLSTANEQKPDLILCDVRMPRVDGLEFLTSYREAGGEALVLMLDREGICASVGAACTAGTTAPSHVLLAMGCGRTAARAAVRFSLSLETSEEDIDYALKVIPRVVESMRAVYSGRSKK